MRKKALFAKARPLLHRYINSEAVVAPGALIPHHNLFSAFCRLRFKLNREYRIVPVTAQKTGQRNSLLSERKRENCDLIDNGRGEILELGRAQVRLRRVRHAVYAYIVAVARNIKLLKFSLTYSF